MTVLFFAVVAAALVGYAFGCWQSDRDCLHQVDEVLKKALGGHNGE